MDTSSSPSGSTRPTPCAPAARAVACAFRDHVLSDLIGFTYAGWAADAAADDFVARLAEAGRRYRDRTGGGEALIPIILDGENAWEHFEGGGRPFLRALYRRLSGHPELRTVTMAEACREPRHDLAGNFSRIVDRRELLHLDRTRRRPAGVEPAGGRAPGAGRARERGRRRRRARRAKRC